MTRKLATSALVLMLTTACGSEGGGAFPAPRPAQPDASPNLEAGADSAADAPAPHDAAADADAAVVSKRTVLTRDPFGNFTVFDNLLLDGDFEWATDFASQYPWMLYPGGDLPDLRLGPSCRSGMKCASVAPGSGIAGFGVRPAGGAPNMQVSLWVHVESLTSCEAVEVSLSNCFLPGANPQLDNAAYPEPSDDGWCRLQGVLPAPSDAPCLFVSVSDYAMGAVIIDDVVMQSAPASSRKLASKKASQHHTKIVAGLRAAARARLHPVTPAPPAVPPALRNKAH